MNFDPIQYEKNFNKSTNHVYLRSKVQKIIGILNFISTRVRMVWDSPCFVSKIDWIYTKLLSHKNFHFRPPPYVYMNVNIETLLHISTHDLYRPRYEYSFIWHFNLSNVIWIVERNANLSAICSQKCQNASS